MSGKFMKVKKVCISTLTLLVICSQLSGCASATPKEMLNMYNNNQSITIEVATPISQEQGTEVFVDWTELASLNNYDAFRMEFDDILGVTAHKETGVTSAQNRCESYELSYCLQVEKAGIPEEIYKALVVAQQKGLITGSECRWSDGIIKGEALTILTILF